MNLVNNIKNLYKKLHKIIIKKINKNNKEFLYKEQPNNNLKMPNPKLTDSANKTVI